jgi:Galactose oxidase, central domain
VNGKSNLLIPLLLSGIAIAQSPGTFTPTGRMISPRANHTATLLNNGKVLVTGGSFVISVGGTWTNSVLSSAELYDPATGAFAATGNMSSARAGHTATLLTNGQVLITGGIVGQSPAFTTAELYDPSMGTFTPTGSMTIGRVGHTATLLRNGQVLITGGENGGYPLLASAELYDPSTGTFTATESMTTFRIGHTATLLSNGKVLIDGGEGGFSPSAEIYDPAASTFSQTGKSTYYPSYLSSGSASLLPDGKVLLTLYSHRDEDLDPTNMAELYDPSAATFLATGNMTTYRNLPTATLLPDGTVLIAGLNYYTVGAAISPAELYDPAAGTFLATGNMTAGRIGHTATLLPDGTVLVAGGAERDGNTNSTISWLSTAELYHPATLIPAPVLYSLSDDGNGQGAIWHGDTGQLASADNPASSGEVLSMYTASLIKGSVIPPQVAVGGQAAEVLYFGDAPGYPGYYQVNFRVPGGVAVGGAVPVRLNYLSRPSNGVTIGVR